MLQFKKIFKERVMAKSLYKRVKEEEKEYLYFGSYPQTDVTDEMAKELKQYAIKLPTKNEANGWSSYKHYYESKPMNYAWYKDVEHNGEKFRAVYYTMLRPATSNDDYAHLGEHCSNLHYRKYKKKFKVYWFKFESIKWQILKEENKRAFIVTAYALDSVPYQSENMPTRAASIYLCTPKVTDQKAYASNYEFSEIRKWMNTKFYKWVFSQNEKRKILTTEVDNSVESANTSLCFASPNTFDKVFGLSKKEIEEYIKKFNDQDLFVRKPTDYAKIQGVSTVKEVKSAGRYGGAVASWTRSMQDRMCDTARLVYFNGELDYDYVGRACYAPMPAINIKL